MSNYLNTNIKEYFESISNNNLTEKQVYELVKTRFSYNFISNSKKEKYQTINKKIIYNTYDDLFVMNKMCYDLCIKNIEIYKNWLDTFCGPEVYNKKFVGVRLELPKGKIDISIFEKSLLFNCNLSDLNLDSIVENKGINNETNIHRSVGILTKILRDSENRKKQILKKEYENKKKKEDKNKKPNEGLQTTNIDNNQMLNNAIESQNKNTKEYCIITSEFCKNIKNIWSMLPRNDINIKDYNSSIKRVIKRKKKINYLPDSDILVELVNKLFNNE
tara:strand:+ start:346 stop:1170 length:825 start_codon:yes stop_codon:yes gene_type:complete